MQVCSREDDGSFCKTCLVHVKNYKRGEIHIAGIENTEYPSLTQWGITVRVRLVNLADGLRKQVFGIQRGNGSLLKQSPNEEAPKTRGDGH